MPRKVLIVEDDLKIAELLKIHLEDLDCRTSHIMDGKSAVLEAGKSFDLIILDLNLPGKDGIEVCREIRAKEVDTPVLMLTARSDELDKVLGLEIGADDYMTKPFSIREFISRVKAIFRREELIRRKDAEKEEVLRFMDLEIDRNKRKVSKENKPVELTPKEFELLVYLASRPGKSYSRQDILSKVWGYDFNGYEHTVNSHINRLRAKIENDLNNPVYILTAWGVGYRFNDEI